MAEHEAPEELVRKVAGPALLAERERLSTLDRWWRWEHDAPSTPRQSTKEYRELVARAQTPWLGLVVTAVAQALYVEGYRRADSADDVDAWQDWQTNRLDSRQSGVHRSALAYGFAHTIVLPGQDPLTGDPAPWIRGRSPRRLASFYRDPAADDWPEYALEVDPAEVDGRPGWSARLYDAERVWNFTASADFAHVTYLDWTEHGIGVCPVVRFANLLDLEGRTPGEVEPLIPVAGRIDQTVFDRLVVQRFGAWVVRTVAGMAAPEQLTGETEEEWKDRTKLRLRIEDLLVSESHETRFGSLPATPLDGFIAAHDADVRVLAAVSQTPPHHLLGQMANLSAEALAAAESSLMRKVDERRHSFGEAWEQTFQLADVVMGRIPDRSAQVRWKDTESRSLSQAVDALAKLSGIGLPVELLLDKIPGWSQQDVERAREALASGPMDGLLSELIAGQTSAVPEVEDPADLKAAADALGALIRAGVDPVQAAERVGLDGLTFPRVPVSVRIPESEAADLEG